MKVRDAGDGRLSPGNRELPVDAIRQRDVGAVRPRPDELVGCIPAFHGARGREAGLLPPAIGEVRAGQPDPLQPRAAGKGAASDGFHGGRDGDLGQRGASRERIVSDARQTVRKGDRRKRRALVEGACPDARHRLRDRDRGQARTAVAEHARNRREPGRELERCQGAAGPEDGRSERGNGIRNRDVRQVRALVERVRPDARHAVRDRYRGQGGAIVERIVADGRHRISAQRTGDRERAGRRGRDGGRRGAAPAHGRLSVRNREGPRDAVDRVGQGEATKGRKGQREDRRSNRLFHRFFPFFRSGANAPPSMDIARFRFHLTRRGDCFSRV